MHWHFPIITPDRVETNVTQRDQFLNDDVDRSDSLVRETNQNSLDAAVDGAVRVRFTHRTWEDGLEGDFVRTLFEGYQAHAVEAGVDLSDVDFDRPTALIIEDFGTRGLTGATDRRDKDDFSDFWRRHGKSHKTGKSGGRWGLGKLVFSCSSKLNAFFGLTCRADDPGPFLMGQAVLDTHTLDEVDYEAHGFFSTIKETDPQQGLPVPLTDEGFVADFCTSFGLTRATEPGLSIVIPFPHDSLTTESMIEVAIINYFIPILRGQLVLDFNGEVVDSSSLRTLLDKYAAGKIPDSGPLFDFVERLKSFPEDGAISARDDWWRDGKVLEDDFSEKDLARLRDGFGKGEIVAVKLPIDINHKTDGRKQSWFYVFVKRPPELSKGRDFYIRGGITVPNEAKFRERKAFGALVATDTVIAEFLGDAENPAHTKWNGQADKLKKYRDPATRLRAIRNSVVNLHDLLAQAVEEEEERALLDFFWTPEHKQPKAKKGTETPPKPEEIPSPTPKPCRIESRADGFSILPKDEIPAKDLPLEGSILVAYDRLQGSPFKKYSPLDFDFSKSGDVAISATNVTVISAAENTIRFQIDKPDFELNVAGFDANRDLIVRAKI